jgi:hypothetical protein
MFKHRYFLAHTFAPKEHLEILAFLEHQSSIIEYGSRNNVLEFWFESGAFWNQ